MKRKKKRNYCFTVSTFCIPGWAWRGLTSPTRLVVVVDMDNVALEFGELTIGATVLIGMGDLFKVDVMIELPKEDVDALLKDGLAAGDVRNAPRRYDWLVKELVIASLVTAVTGLMLQPRLAIGVIFCSELVTEIVDDDSCQLVSIRFTFIADVVSSLLLLMLLLFIILLKVEPLCNLMSSIELLVVTAKWKITVILNNLLTKKKCCEHNYQIN